MPEWDLTSPECTVWLCWGLDLQREDRKDWTEAQLCLTAKQPHQLESHCTKGAADFWHGSGLQLLLEAH